MRLQSNEPRGAEGILETRQAYDFTLDTIGQDIHSGEQVAEPSSFTIRAQNNRR
jgi:hypothetical protein